MKVLADGILSTGTNILDIGVVPTPILYFVAHHHDCHSGVVNGKPQSGKL
ncbi:MAG: hypothetical protein H0A75_04035 [Candidatus Methanofishera endochildressiae]|uniref:Alpha-D-phosphohexomutase alpha/beta/alpha domain-containing protein n=1 Tax=Candidatus Methanofishera endochildressiae TaxID=2738884 RepID=A0A7Z0MNN8_9GAMM|nr:hypothetical protein [Candidatus Methanofishera endochildressiae]